jgi:STAS-like domain of unknown function (DUF4325)
MPSSEFVVATAFRPLGTRESGVQARQQVLRALEEHSVVILNFSDAHPTPSFADELVGHLAGALGAQAFRERVKIVGLGAAERSLLQHVVMRRLPGANAESRQLQEDEIY